MKNICLNASYVLLDAVTVKCAIKYNNTCIFTILISKVNNVL